MSVSSSSSSSASLVKPYTPRNKRNDTRTKTLPSLANSELGTKKQKIIDIDEISPMMTRAQRLAKEKTKTTREDAFDTSDEEGDGSNK